MATKHRKALDPGLNIPRSNLGSSAGFLHVMGCYDCRCASVSGELQANLKEYERRLTRYTSNNMKEKRDQDRFYLKNVFPNPLPHQGIHANLQSS